MNYLSLSPLAREDLDEIRDYVAIRQHRPEAAGRLIETFYETFRLLASQPLMGEARLDLADLVHDIRSVSVGSYVIYFQPHYGGVRIGRVIHGARDVRAAFLRE
jgi:toxin ParE1/3/4